MHAQRLVDSRAEPRRIVALAFDSADEAREAMRAAQQLQEAELITVHDSVFIARDPGGRIEVTDADGDPTPLAAAVPCSLLGALVGTLVAGPLGFLIGGVVAGSSGALVAKLVDTGIPQHVVGELRELARPGQTVLALLVSDVAGMIVIEQLRRFRAVRVIYARLPPTAFEVVRHALGRG